MNENQAALQAQTKPSDEGPKEIDEFKKSLRLAERLLEKIGLRVEYEDRTMGLRWLSQYLFFPVSFMQLVSSVAGETTYFLGSLGRSLMEVTAIAPCLGFCLMGLYICIIILPWSSHILALEQTGDKIRRFQPYRPYPNQRKSNVTRCAMRSWLPDTGLAPWRSNLNWLPGTFNQETIITK